MDDRSVPGSRIDMVGLCKPYGVDRCLRRKPITSFLKSSWNADRSKPGASSQSLLGRFLRMVSVQGGRKEKWMPFETKWNSGTAGSRDRRQRAQHPES